MANEAVLRKRLEDPIDFTVADDVGIEKGSVMVMHDPRGASGAGTAVTSLAVNQACAGILAREKIADDGRTRAAIFQKGVFDVHASGAVGIGEPVGMAELNDVKLADPTLSGAQIIGYALETAADDETFQIKLELGG
jgi:hypothetical protein